MCDIKKIIDSLKVKSVILKDTCKNILKNLKMGTFFKKSWKIVKIDKIQKLLKSIAEIVSSLPLCIWIVCATPGLVCGGGDKGIGTPCTCKKNQVPITFYASTWCFDTFVSPPQTMPDAVQTIQIYRGKLEPISAIDFKGFWILSIFTIFSWI